MSSIQPAQQVAPQPAQPLSEAEAYVKAEEFRKIIEVEVLRIIKELAEKGETSKEDIQNIATTTLTLIHPGMSLEELFTNAVKLDDKYNQLAPVVVKIMRIYEEQYEKKALNQVSLLVKTGKYNEANEMVKKVLVFKYM